MKPIRAVNKDDWFGQRSITTTGGCLYVSLPRKELRDLLGEADLEAFEQSDVICELSAEDRKFTVRIPDPDANQDPDPLG